jgi:DNA (cytosine-5)-methyltransferase 1
VTRPRLLDLFCGAGGAARGYHNAGFDVVGVDINPQPNYPYEFWRSDAFHYLDGWVDLSTFDAIHASPPCQGYAQWNNLNAERYGTRKEHPLLIDPVRAALQATMLPYVIENVVGAPLRTHMMLCGSMFGLNVRRHRNFETNMLILGPPTCQHTQTEIAVYGKLDGRRIWTRVDGTEVRAAKTLEQAQHAMGIDWMNWNELREAIPPAYTEWIGEQLLQHLTGVQNPASVNPNLKGTKAR